MANLTFPFQAQLEEEITQLEYAQQTSSPAANAQRLEYLRDLRERQLYVTQLHEIYMVLGSINNFSFWDTIFANSENAMKLLERVEQLAETAVYVRKAYVDGERVQTEGLKAK